MRYLFPLLFLSACVIPPHGTANDPTAVDSACDALATRPAPSTNVVLITLDGVRWQEVFHGVDAELAARHGLPSEQVVPGRELLPHVHGLVQERGFFVGAPGDAALRASGPSFISLPGYSEIFSGRATECTTNECDGAAEATVLDDLRATHARQPGDVAVFASWEPIARAATLGDRGIVLSTGKTIVHNAEQLRDDPMLWDLIERGSEAPSYPGRRGFLPDRYTAAIALRYLDARDPKVLYVGLGETDEYGHKDDYPSYLASLRMADHFVHEVVSRTDQRDTRTVVLVTTDHGRADNFRDHGADFPESGRVWLAVVGASPAPQQRTAYRLADIAPTLRALYGLPATERGGCPVALTLPGGTSPSYVSHQAWH